MTNRKIKRTAKPKMRVSFGTSRNEYPGKGERAAISIMTLSLMLGYNE